MGRIHAVREDDGRWVLVEITCDGGCGSALRPGPEVVVSGWEKRAVVDGRTATTTFLCPSCRR